jgi:lipopolysaccharide export system protein LptA
MFSKATEQVLQALGSTLMHADALGGSKVPSVVFLYRMMMTRLKKMNKTLLLFALSLYISLSFISADTFTFRADSMSGSRALGRETTILVGNAEVRSDNLLLRADRIEISGNNNRFIECFGNVWGHEEDKNILFFTDRLRYDRTLKIARLEGNSTLEDRQNEIVARGRFIEYDDENEMAVFQISVRLFKDDMVCRSEYAVYNRRDKILDLTGFPVVFKKEDEFRADKIRVDLDTDDVIMEGSVSGTIVN